MFFSLLYPSLAKEEKKTHINVAKGENSREPSAYDQTLAPPPDQNWRTVRDVNFSLGLESDVISKNQSWAEPRSDSRAVEGFLTSVWEVLFLNNLSQRWSEWSCKHLNSLRETISFSRNSLKQTTTHTHKEALPFPTAKSRQHRYIPPSCWS